MHPKLRRKAKIVIIKARKVKKFKKAFHLIKKIQWIIKFTSERFSARKLDTKRI